MIPDSASYSINSVECHRQHVEIDTIEIESDTSIYTLGEPDPDHGFGEIVQLIF